MATVLYTQTLFVSRDRTWSLWRLTPRLFSETWLVGVHYRPPTPETINRMAILPAPEAGFYGAESATPFRVIGWASEGEKPPSCAAGKTMPHLTSPVWGLLDDEP